jgi:hypothetical protein
MCYIHDKYKSVLTRESLVKCLYYLASTLDSTRSISDDLHDVGINDWFLHVISRDEAGLRKEHIHSSNYFETLDLARGWLIGANLGFIAGVIGVGLMVIFKPFGPDVPGYVYFMLVAVATLFGTWEGGLYGVANENRKLTRFHDDIEAGKYLILIYSRNTQEDAVKNMMSERHPDARHVATDRHFVNPFSVVRRKRRLTT